MHSAPPHRVKEVFTDALERPVADRARFLAEMCDGDHALRQAVESLLAAHDGAGKFLAHPTQDERSPAPPQTDDVRARLQRGLAGRYSIETELGRGGMGIVFLAREVALDRRVAIKVLPPALAIDPDCRERFLREARTAANMSHPNIVPIHAVDEQGDLVFFVMAYVDGETLGDRVRRAGPLKAAHAAKLMQEVAWAVAYAHTRGVIHRDVKPDNILIENGSGRALVTDFGIARVSATDTLSAQGDVLGTLQYMSPEQASGDNDIDGRADLYSLGVTAFFALTGRLPFESSNSVAVMAMHIGDPPPPLRSVTTTVPAKLAAVVDRCLAKSPAARFATGEALAEAVAATQIMPREVAPSIREFLTAARGAVGQATVLALIWWALLEVFPRIQEGRFLGGPLDVIFAMLAGITPIVLINPIFSARGVLRAGMDEHDVADAVATSASARDANVEYELERLTRLGRRLSTVWGRAAFIVLSAVMVPIVVELLLDAASFGFPLWAVIQWLLPAAGLAFMLSLAIAPAKIIAALTRGTPEFGRVWRAVWAGPIGRWFFRFAGIGLKRSKAVPAMEGAPTEVLLRRAAGELFQQLPKAQRARLGDLPDVIGRLETVAKTLRQRRDELAMAIAEVGEPDASNRRDTLVTELRATEAAVNDRMSAAVGALETLRLDLLRLRAGLGTPDDLTTAIEAARVAGENIDIEMAAHAEVEAAVELRAFYGG